MNNSDNIGETRQRTEYQRYGKVQTYKIRIVNTYLILVQCVKCNVNI